MTQKELFAQRDEYTFRYNPLEKEITRLKEKYKGHDIYKIEENKYSAHLMNVYLRVGKGVEIVKEKRLEVDVKRWDWV